MPNRSVPVEGGHASIRRHASRGSAPPGSALPRGPTQPAHLQPPSVLIAAYNHCITYACQLVRQGTHRIPCRSVQTKNSVGQDMPSSSLGTRSQSTAAASASTAAVQQSTDPSWHVGDTGSASCKNAGEYRNLGNRKADRGWGTPDTPAKGSKSRRARWARVFGRRHRRASVYCCCCCCCRSGAGFSRLSGASTSTSIIGSRGPAATGQFRSGV